MDLSVLFKRAGKVAAKNSPAILTAIGVTGTLGAAYLAAKGAFQASEVLTKATEHKKAQLGEGFDEEVDGALSFEEKFNLTWRLYAPAASCVVLSVTAIICANRIGDRRTAAMASAYSIVEKSYAEYRAKTTEKVGKKKEQEIRDEIAQDRQDANPPSSTTFIVSGKGSTRCFDKWSGQYFTNDMESIRSAVNDFNQLVINSTFASLTELYHMIGVRPTRASDEVGWDTDKLLEVEYSGTLHADGTPCIAIDFRTMPNPRYSQLY